MCLDGLIFNPNLLVRGFKKKKEMACKYLFELISLSVTSYVENRSPRVFISSSFEVAEKREEPRVLKNALEWEMEVDRLK